MRIETVKHAADRILDEFLFVYRLDVVGFNLGKYLGKGLQILERDLSVVLQGMAANSNGK